MNPRTALTRTAPGTVVAVASLFLFAACAGEETAPTSPPSPSASPTPAASHKTPPTQKQAKQVARDVVGMAEVEAVATAQAQGLTTRVVQRDGQDFPITMDLRTDRINLVITDGKVTRATVG